MMREALKTHFKAMDCEVVPYQGEISLKIADKDRFRDDHTSTVCSQLLATH